MSLKITQKEGSEDYVECDPEKVFWKVANSRSKKAVFFLCELWTRLLEKVQEQFEGWSKEVERFPIKEMMGVRGE